jgi:hypothetical protein
MFHHLVESLPRRVEAVMAAKGEPLHINAHDLKSNSNQIAFVTYSEYNRHYREMLICKPLTNNAVQETELRKYLLNKLK